MKFVRLFVLTTLLLNSSHALAEAVRVDWSLNLFPLDGVTYEVLSVDASLGPRYVGLTGALLAKDDGIDLPVTGTCVPSDAWVVVCDLHMRRYVMLLEVNSSLSGNFRIMDPDGEQIASGLLFYSGIVSN